MISVLPVSPAPHSPAPHVEPHHLAVVQTEDGPIEARNPALAQAAARALEYEAARRWPADLWAAITLDLTT